MGEKSQAFIKTHVLHTGRSHNAQVIFMKHLELEMLCHKAGSMTLIVSQCGMVVTAFILQL